MMNFQRSLPNLENIGKNCHLQRIKAGMSTPDVKAAVAVDPSALRKLERGLMKNPSIATLLLLCQAYGCSMDDLVNHVPTEDDLKALADVGVSG